MAISGEIFLKNIYYLAKNNNTKINEIEKEANVSSGYFARLTKDDGRTSLPNLEVLLSVSKYFKIPLELLATVSLKELSKSEEYLSNFVAVLITKTSNRDIMWKETPLKDFYVDVQEASMNNCNFKLHPLGKFHSGFNGDDRQYFFSYFNNKEMKLGNSIFAFESDDATYFLVMTVSEEDSHEYEFYKIPKNNEAKEIIKLFRSTKYDLALFDQVEELYNECLRLRWEPKIDSNTKSELDKILSFVLKK